jgi:peptide/nickel transport system permease protein
LQTTVVEKEPTSNRNGVLWRARNFVSMLLRKRASKVGTGIILGILLLVLIGPFFIRYGPMQNTSNILQPPNLAHPFGTDNFGHDLLSQIVYGAYPSLLVAIAGSIGSVAIGLIVGVFSGYYRRTGAILSGISDGILTFPILVIVILVTSLFIPSNGLIALLLILMLWAPCARAIRAQVASLKRRAYVNAAKTSGVGDFNLLLFVIIPAVASIAFAYFIINTAVSLILTTSLEFLGIGNTTVASWGSIYYWAQQYAFPVHAWWWIVIPGIFIALFISGLALIGFSIEEVFNPALRK